MRLVIALIVVGVLLVAVAAGVFYYIVHNLIPSDHKPPETPAELKTAGILTGESFLEKKPWYEAGSLGEVTQIVPGWPAGREGAAVLVLGEESAHFVDANSKLTKLITFTSGQRCPRHVVRMTAEGEYGFLTRGAGWSCDAMLADSSGDSRWTYGGVTGVDDSAGGDTDGDGIPEFVVGFNGDGGIHLLDAGGKKIWQEEEGNVWHVEILDTNGNGRGEIVHSNSRGQLLVRDNRGKVLRVYLRGQYVSDFSLIRWGGEEKPSHILIVGEQGVIPDRDGKITVLNARGEVVRQLELPLGGLLHESMGTSVSLGNAGQMLAVLQSYSPFDRSLLSILDEKGELVYQEVLEDNCSGIEAVALNSSPQLLVGCTGKVWSYVLASKKSSR